MRLAFYDMDKTVTREPTWTRFLLHAAWRRAPWRLALFPAAGFAAIAYLLGLLDRAGLKRWTQRVMLGRALAPDAMADLAVGFADRELAGGVFEGARARIAEDRAGGARVVLATASHRFYAAEIARRLGFDDIIATSAKRDARGHILSELDGENCYGAGKLRMVEAWMERQGIARGEAHVLAYSDHVSDAPLLEWADEAFAVNAHAPLVALAKQNGWTLLDWR